MNTTAAYGLPFSFLALTASTVAARAQAADITL
jgi:hypothetical protein